ncbi:MAG: SbcC/MukB-like Walker B domain-containing protein, partial [Aquificaceae bacterium]
YGNLQKELENKKRELQEKEELEKRKEQLNEEYEIYEILNKDFWDSKHRFPDYVSKIVLHEMVEIANYYFSKFTSGNYTFELDDDLYVLEKNTGHKRPVSSLSGGETFLASLSLAFAVADIMSQNAPLESLFIDEGFGSLDAETRESLSDFLFEHIRGSSDRVIGIITHIDDIADKFSQRIEIEKRGGSAHIKVVY